MNSNLEKQKKFISVLIYLRNNEESIEKYLLGIDAYFSNNFTAYEYVIVNNYSEDNSIKIIKDIKKSIGGKITIVNLAWRHSRERAMIAGHAIAIGDYVFEFDNAILDFDIKELDFCYKKCLSGFDIVSAINTKNIGVCRRLYNKLFKKNAKEEADFRIISRRAINRIYKEVGSFLYRKYAYNRAGFEEYIHYFSGSVEAFKVKENKIEFFSEKVSSLMRYTRFTLIFEIVCFIILSISLILSIARQNVSIIIIPLLLEIGIILVLILNLLSDIYKDITKAPPFVFKSVDRL